MRISVRTYLMAAFAVTAMAPLLVFWIWPYSGIAAQKYDEVWERHLLIAQNLGAAMETYHRDLVATMESFAAKIVEGMGDEARPIFENLYFRHLCVADMQTGRVVRSYMTEQYACPDVIPEPRLTQFRDLADGGGVGLSGVVTSEEERPRIFLVTYVEEFMVVGAVHTDFFLDLQRRISFGRLGHATIVDHTGRILAHPNEQWVQGARDVSHVAPVARMIAGETGVETFYSPAMDLEMIAGFTSLPASGWGVMVPQPTNELEEAAAKFNRDALIIMSLGLLFSFALAIAASLLLSRRVRAIEAQVSAVGTEDEAPFTAFRQGNVILRELQSLEKGVLRMAQSTFQARSEIQQRNRDLEHSNVQLREEIEERRIAQRQREASEAQFKSLFENVPIPIRVEDLSGIAKAIDSTGISDPDAFSDYLDQNPDFITRCREAIHILDVNRAAQELHRYPSKESLVTSVVSNLSPESEKAFRQTIVAIHAKKKRQDYEISIYPRDGEPRRVASTWTIMPGHEETYRRILLTSVDITDAIKSEERMLKAQKMEAVGQLTGGVAHDFNNLLTVIGGHVELIGDDPENAKDYIPPVLRAVQQGAQLTQHLLAFSRQQPLAPKAIDMVRLVSDATELFRRTLGDNIEIVFRHDMDLWLAQADPTQVQNALLNLALNARDAMPDGGRLLINCQNIHVRANELEDLIEGDYVKVSVQDNGTGMSAEVLARVFEPFFSTKEVGKGSGLGLSMIYGFAKQSNGHAEVFSTLGQGTTVSVYLPRAESEVEAKKENGDLTWAKEGNGIKILVLEDQPDVRAYLHRALSRAGYLPILASDARSAQVALDSHPDIKVAVCDIMLPNGVSGTEFALNAKRQRSGLGIIFMSGHPPSIDGGLDDPLKDHIVLAKPIETKVLVDTLRSIVME